MKKTIHAVLAAAAFAVSAGVLAQTPPPPPPPPPYGESIGVEAARKATAAAIAESKKNNWFMAVAVVDTGGNLVYFERQDGTQNGSTWVAVDKAKSSVNFRRPAKAFEDVLAAGGGGLRILGLSGAVPIEGGVPIVANGKIIGAIGTSGGTAQQDGVVAAAGINAIK